MWMTDGTAAVPWAVRVDRFQVAAISLHPKTECGCISDMLAASLRMITFLIALMVIAAVVSGGPEETSAIVRNLR